MQSSTGIQMLVLAVRRRNAELSTMFARAWNWMRERLVDHWYDHAVGLARPTTQAVPRAWTLIGGNIGKNLVIASKSDNMSDSGFFSLCVCSFKHDHEPVCNELDRQDCVVDDSLQLEGAETSWGWSKGEVDT